MTMVKFSICMGFVGENGVLDHNKNEDGSVNVEVDLRVGSHIG